MKNFTLVFITLFSAMVLTGCGDYRSGDSVIVELDSVNSYQIENIHDDYDIAVCSFSVSSYDPHSNDKYLFDSYDIGNSVSYNYDDRWLDINSYSVYDIMSSKIDRAYLLGCDEVLFEDTDIYYWDNGFGIDEDITQQYLSDLVSDAHSLNLDVSAYDFDIGDSYNIQNLFDYLY